MCLYVDTILLKIIWISYPFVGNILLMSNCYMRSTNGHQVNTIIYQTVVKNEQWTYKIKKLMNAAYEFMKSLKYIL